MIVGKGLTALELLKVTGTGDLLLRPITQGCAIYSPISDRTADKAHSPYRVKEAVETNRAAGLRGKDCGLNSDGWPCFLGEDQLPG